MSFSTQAAYPPSLWRDTAGDGPVFTELSDKGRQYDVAIIGGGYTGLSAALHLAQAGASCVVLEARAIGWGASGRNGGQVIAGLKYDPDDLIAHFGPEAGQAMVRTVGGSADMLFDLVEQHGIDCDAVRNGWIQAAHCGRALARQKNRAAQWNALGAQTEILDAPGIAALTGAQDYVGGWLDRRGGKIQPLKFAFGLARVAAARGAHVFVQSPVHHMAHTQGMWHLSTPRGGLTARQVIIGTNGYTDRLWPSLKESVVPAYSVQISTVPLAPDLLRTVLPGGQSLSETRRVLRYSQVDAAGRLVIGTRGPERDQATYRDARSLIRDMEGLFPQLRGVRLDHVWTGRVAMTADHLPHLHHLAEGAYAALGYNGRGVALATLMGRLLALKAGGATDTEIGFPVMPLKAIPLHHFSGIGAAAYGHWYDLMDRLKL
jgi:glycine/D-amino acid oxidase-like deaminating enzyme